MDSSDAGCEAYCAVKPIGKGVQKRTAPTRHAGPLPTLMRLGFSTCNTPISQHVSPLAGKTTNRRAVCREIRMSGSEGGGIEPNRCFLPLYLHDEISNVWWRKSRRRGSRTDSRLLS